MERAGGRVITVRNVSLSAVVLVLLAAVATGQPSEPVSLVASHDVTSQSRASGPDTLFADYCEGCHNDFLTEGGMSLEHVDLSQPGRHAEQLEKVILKLRSGMMPPAGMPRPDRRTIAAFVADLKGGIDQAAAANPNPGRPVLHRLNRVEYANSIRDLLDLEVNAETFLPPDDMSQGYDNMSDVLTVSPTLLQSYISAAGKISRLAVGDPDATPSVETYVVPVSYSQLFHREGAPFGTRGGIVVRHTFPADGRYVFRASLYFASLGGLFGDNKPAEGEQLEIAIDGKREWLFDIDRKMKATEDLRTPPFEVTAGQHTISAAFIQRAEGPVQDFLMPFEQATADATTGNIQGLTGLPHLKNLGIDGPYDVTGVSDTPSRRKIFSCRPADARDEPSCASEIIAGLVRQAFRRPVNDDDRARLMALYESGRRDRDFDAGIRMAVQAIVSDPEFLFRFERTPPSIPPGENHRVADLELASRLSYFLWSGAPDDELIAVADAGRLNEPAVLEQQVRRMLADPRAEALTTNFASHWLRLQNLRDSHPDVFEYPDWDLNLTVSMRRETELLFDSVVREDRNIIDLLTADYTFVDQKLARHYGIPNIIGKRFRRVTIEDENRRGLLGHGSILTLTSLANRTSPVIRGAWIMSVLLGTPPPRPPADVPPLQENETGEQHLSVRERMEEHRANPACAACHDIIDPLGFSLENFDGVGAWRTKDSGFAIDPSGMLFDGTEVDGPVALREFVVRSKDLFITNFTRNLLMYGLGRVFQYYDMPAVRAIARQAAQQDNRFSSFVLGIVKSTAFQMRRAEEIEATTSADQPLQDH